MFCGKCGAENPGGNFCTRCGSALVPPSPASPGYAPEGGDEPISYVVPYRNVPALIAYYMGVFSLIPGLGFFLGIAAFILGILGLKEAARNPQAHGRAHAWVGILAGGTFALAHVALVVVILIASRS